MAIWGKENGLASTLSPFFKEYDRSKVETLRATRFQCKVDARRIVVFDCFQRNSVKIATFDGSEALV